MIGHLTTEFLAQAGPLTGVRVVRVVLEARHDLDELHHRECRSRAVVL